MMFMQIDSDTSGRVTWEELSAMFLPRGRRGGGPPPSPHCLPPKAWSGTHRVHSLFHIPPPVSPPPSSLAVGSNMALGCP